MMHDKAMRSLSAMISSLICGAFVACAGNDTPPVDDALEQAIAQGFVNGAVAAAGAGGRASGGATRPTGNAGSASVPAAGSGGSGGEDVVVDPPASTGGTGSASEADPPPPAGGACDGFAVLAANCGSSACHGAGGLGDFADSEDAAKAYVGTSGSVSCAAEGPLLNPENPRQSIIVQKVNGTVPCGGPMPIGAPPLSDDDISCLEEWIGTL